MLGQLLVAVHQCLYPLALNCCPNICVGHSELGLGSNINRVGELEVKKMTNQAPKMCKQCCTALSGSCSVALRPRFSQCQPAPLRHQALLLSLLSLDHQALLLLLLLQLLLLLLLGFRLTAAVAVRRSFERGQRQY